MNQNAPAFLITLRPMTAIHVHVLPTTTHRLVCLTQQTRMMQGSKPTVINWALYPSLLGEQEALSNGRSQGTSISCAPAHTHTPVFPEHLHTNTSAPRTPAHTQVLPKHLQTHTPIFPVCMHTYTSALYGLLTNTNKHTWLVTTHICCNTPTWQDWKGTYHWIQSPWEKKKKRDRCNSKPSTAQ